MPPTRPTSRARVVVVDDHAMLAGAFVSALADRADAVAVDPAGRSAEEVVALVWQAEPDIVLLDLQLGNGLRGQDLIRPLAAVVGSVVVVAAVPSAAVVEEAIASGAVGVLDKGMPFRLLLDEIDVLVGRSASDDLRLLASLTQMQANVLGDLLAGAVAAEIAAARCVSLTTVRTHIRGILMKLGVQSQVAAIALAQRSGWRAD